MKSGKMPQSRRDNIVIQEFENEVLIYDLSINKAFCLNETSAIIWQECNGKKSVAEISQTLSQKLKSNVSEDLVWLALNQFKKDNLLVESSNFITPLDGLNRREIVKRIGFASIIALPVIASVTAPSAIHAQSNCLAPPSCAGIVDAMTPNNLPDGCFCLSNLNCLSGICPIVSMVCSGTLDGFCNQIGNMVGASAPCCPCQSNLDCVQGICPVNTMICAAI